MYSFGGQRITVAITRRRFRNMKKAPDPGAEVNQIIDWIISQNSILRGDYNGTQSHF